MRVITAALFFLHRVCMRHFVALSGPRNAFFFLFWFPYSLFVSKVSTAESKPMEEEQSSSDDPHSPISTENGGMRTSLDQGMAAVRRWIHSTESHRIPNSEDDDLADFPRDFDNFSNPSDGGECSLGDSFPSADHCQSQH